VFEQCLDEARRKEAGGGDADDATALRKAEAVAKAQAAALEELEAKSLRAAYAAGTQYAIRDLAFKVCDIVGMEPAKELEPLVRHFYADGRARHGRIDGAHVPRVLAEYVPFVEQRVGQLYARSNAAVRAQPVEATALLRRISTLNDYLSDSRAGFKAQRSAVGGAVAQQQRR
jgi:hypothetical protein